MERRRREMEEEAALMAELAALEAEEANADPVIKYIPESITVKDLAEVLGKKGSDLVMNLMKKGKMLAINATLDFDTAASIAEEYNVILEQEEEKDIMEEAFGAEEEEDESKLEERPPVVVVMGHVDHGKTELVKRLADELFHAPESLIRLDMSEFMEKFSVSRMIGSPPGYVGYDEAGQLTEKIRRRPYSVVLFDEIEKAHPDVMNLLLQILDDGRITDAQGRTVNFENTVIILTTNAGSNTRTGTLGFGLSADDQSRERAQRALNEFLRPEFLNRLDEIVYFNHLTEENFRAIASLMLGEVRTAMAERGMTLHWTPAVVDYLVAKGYSETYGARNLRRTIQRDVEDAIASAVVAQRKAAGDVAIDAQNDRIVVTIDGKEVTA